MGRGLEAGGTTLPLGGPGFAYSFLGEVPFLEPRRWAGPEPSFVKTVHDRKRFLLAGIRGPPHVKNAARGAEMHMGQGGRHTAPGISALRGEAFG